MGANKVTGSDDGAMNRRLERAVALHQQGHLPQACKIYEEILRRHPGHFDALHLLGVATAGSGDTVTAIHLIRKAIEIEPNNHRAHSNLAAAFRDARQPEAALASYDRSIAIRGTHEAHYYRGTVLCELRRWTDAVASFDRAIALKYDYAEAFSNRAFALHEVQRDAESLASCDRAIQFDPRLIEAHCNRGTLLVATRQVSEALASYDRAIELNPNLASARVNRALARLLAGDYENGWPEYEWRWRDESGWIIKEKRDFRQPQWLGEESLDGKTILLQSEQGYGDSIQFCRYVSLVASRGARVILEVPAALAPLMRGLDGLTQLVTYGDRLPAFDCYSPLLSLPMAMRTTLCSIPSEIPYLRPDALRTEFWRQKLGQRNRPRVGLAWSGGFRPQRPELWSVNQRRNIPLARLAGLKSASVEFYSLQKDTAAAAELGELILKGWEGPDIRDHSEEMLDFADTAAFIEHLDLVISVDTAVAHLAGAMGKPVWVLNRYDSCWRWLLDRDDSPWYPTARLYRQARPGDWEGVIGRISSDLAAWSEQR